MAKRDKSLLGRWNPPGGRRFWLLLAVLLAVNFLIFSSIEEKPEPPEVTYSFFVEQVQADNVERVTAVGARIEGRFEQAVDPPGGTDRSITTFRVLRPAFAGGEALVDRLLDNDVVVSARAEPGRPLWQTIVLGFGPTLLFVALLVFLLRRFSPGSGGLGRSRAKRYEPEQETTTFDDVAGIDEAKEELTEIVDCLRNPEQYQQLGGRIPRGVLLSGPPGTGKTLLARAVAGEADAPFFSLSASEFVEMVVGVGASRVRDLFRKAKEEAPAIVFIDELDAIGRNRSSGTTQAGQEEREQTLNQILTEMDGFTGAESVIVIGATNRPEILDSALLRPGRFDRQVVVNPPDHEGRRRILEVHTRQVPLGADVDLETVASMTPGMVGADLRNLVNEAALGAARRGASEVTLPDFTNAFERVVLGAERRITIEADERERTAYHESGHALLGMLVPGADPVRKVSIVPRGRALGVTLQSPESDRYGYSRDYLRGRIVGTMGGRAAEQLVYGEYTTGAESDLEQATRLARLMVGRWGMSEAIGPVSVVSAPGQDPALFPGTGGPVSERTRELVDDEVRRILDECYERALELLHAHRQGLDAMAAELLKRETLDETDAYAVAGLQTPATARLAATSRNGGDPRAATPPAGPLRPDR